MVLLPINYNRSYPFYVIYTFPASKCRCFATWNSINTLKCLLLDVSNCCDSGGRLSAARAPPSEAILRILEHLLVFVHWTWEVTQHGRSLILLGWYKNDNLLLLEQYVDCGYVLCYINETLNTYFTIKGKSSGGSKGTTQSSKQDRKSPVKSPKPSGGKDHGDGDSEEQKSETAAPKVPPLKIVIPGGAGGSGNRNEQEGDGMLSNNPSVVTPTSWRIVSVL